MINHPVGNIKIYLLKKISYLISSIILFVLSIVIKINKKESDIIISNSFYAPWKVDKNFIKVYNQIREFTLLDKRRLYTLWKVSEQLKYLKGSIFDVGCLLGGAGFLLSKNNKNNFTYLFDTFDGYIDNEKFYKKDSFKFTDINFVIKNIKRLNLKKIKVIKGIFPDNAHLNIKKQKIKICHLDVNTYYSTLKSFNFVKDRIIKGGYIIFDDYGMHGADGIKKCINKIYPKLNKKFHFINNFQGQYIMIKK